MFFFQELQEMMILIEMGGKGVDELRWAGRREAGGEAGLQMNKKSGVRYNEQEPDYRLRNVKPLRCLPSGERVRF